MSNARAAQRCSHQLAVAFAFGTAVRGLPAFAARMASLETRHCESRPKWMHGAKRSRSERRHDSVLPGFKCVCYAR
jgi:hypothetical protein